MKTIITAQVIDQALMVTSAPKLASGGENVFQIELTLDRYWDGYGLEAVFYKDKSRQYRVVLTEGVGIIPWELTSEPGEVHFSVRGVSGNVVRSTEAVVLNFVQGSPAAGNHPAPLPDVYKQVLGAMGKNAQAIKAEQARIDNLVGAESVDAELVDIRVGADGVTYACAGDAVRSQYNSLAIGVNRVATNNVVAGYYVLYSDGSMGSHANYSYVSLTVRSGEKYYISETSNTHIAFFDGAVSTTNYIAGHLNAQYVVVPEGATLMTVSVNTASASGLQVFTKISNDRIFDDEITLEKMSPSARKAIKKTVTVGAGGDYTNLLPALIDNPGSTRFVVLGGVYNVYDEYVQQYGSGYFTNYTGYAGTSNKFDAGLYLHDGCELIGIGEVSVVFDYQGANENVKKYFSPLNTTQNNVVENIHFVIGDGSCRYIIHDDYATKSGTNVIRSCVLEGASHLTTSIGGGMGKANSYVIEGCVITGNTGLAIAYHNNEAAGVNKLTVRDCYCDGAIRGAHYGASTATSKMAVSGCKAHRVYLVHGDASAYPNENIELLAWHNDVAVE